jgi:TldD protein
MTPADPAFDHLATARGLLLAPYGLDESRLQQTLARVFDHRADYADLYFQYTRNESFSLEEGIVKSGSFDIQQGVGVRAVAGERTAFSYSDDISAAALTEAADAVRSIARSGGGGSRRVGRWRRAARGRCTGRPIRSPRSMPRPRSSCSNASSRWRARVIHASGR